MNLTLRRILLWLGVAGWLGVIYFFSHQPDLKSELEPFWDTLFRKIAHVLEYFVLHYLLVQALSSHRLTRRRIKLLAVLGTVGYALTDEWHQAYVKGRSGQLTDVAVDSFGVVVYFLLDRIQRHETLPDQ